LSNFTLKKSFLRKIYMFMGFKAMTVEKIQKIKEKTLIFK